MKSKYEKGEWLTQLPPGYDVIKHNKERKIVINAEGRKIQKAWQWKLEGMRNEDISHKLSKMGLFMYPQRIHKIFKNPFYCGLIAHGILDGKVVDGKHEAMVSKENFFKINQIRLDSTRCGISHKKENEFMPLKIFVKCNACGEGMTGYIVKKKNLYYYKCRKEGCNCNKSDKSMHKQLLEKLVQYSAKEKLSSAIANKYEIAYQEKNKENILKKAEYENRLAELKESIEKLYDKFYIKEEMNKEKYDSLSAKLERERLQISEELSKLGNMSSNLAEKLILASELSRKLTDIWASGSFEIKTRLQKLVFPDGMGYDKKTDTLLTPKINEAIFEIARIAGDSAIMKEGFNVTQNKKSPFAEKAGFEPAVRFPVRMFSKHVLSASQAPLLKFEMQM
jgi:site-specific DNA recombinase